MSSEHVSVPSSERPAVFGGAGEWWLPSRADERRKGRLNCLVTHGVKLHLTGSFDNLEAEYFPWQPDIILGEVAGRSVTLHKCWRTDVLEQQPGTAVKPDATYAAEAALAGAHFQTRDDVRFRALAVSYAGLLHWLGMSGISVGNQHRVTYTTFAVSLGGGITADVATDFRQGEDPGLLLDGEKLLYIRFASPASIPLDEWRTGPVRLMQDFLTFAMGTDTPPVRLRVAGLPNTQDGIQLGDIDVYVYGMNNPGAKLDRPSFLLWAFDTDDAGVCVGEWFAKEKMLRHARNLYCGVVRRGPSLALTLQFFLLMLALEGYHRSAQTSKYLPDEDYALIWGSYQER